MCHFYALVVVSDLVPQFICCVWLYVRQKFRFIEVDIIVKLKELTAHLHYPTLSGNCNLNNISDIKTSACLDILFCWVLNNILWLILCFNAPTIQLLFVYYIPLGIQQNLHIVLIMDCSNSTFTINCESNPAFYRKCSVQWMEGWSESSMKKVSAGGGGQQVQRQDQNHIKSSCWVHKVKKCVLLIAPPVECLGFIG